MVVNEKKKFKKNAIRASKNLLSWSTKVAAKGVTLGAIDETEIEALKDIKSDISKGSSDFISSYVSKKLKTHKEDKKSIENFKKTLRNLGKAVKNEQKFPLVIVIDELDRCRPDQSLEILEKMKHLFSVENVVFILVLNRFQMEQSIQKVYGEIDSKTYLQKFINIESSLPKNLDNDVSNGYRKYASHLYNQHEIQLSAGNDFIRYISLFSQFYNLSLRDLERAFLHTVLFLAGLPRDHVFTREVNMIAFLSVIKIKKEEVFRNLKNKKLSYEELIELTEFKKFRTIHHIHNNLDHLLQYCLRPEHEIENARNTNRNNSAGSYPFVDAGDLYEINGFIREEIIPLFCLGFDDFTYSA